MRAFRRISRNSGSRLQPHDKLGFFDIARLSPAERESGMLIAQDLGIRSR
jgi:hypothetical protein